MHERMLRISERIYSAMLVLYPKEFRDAYGPHMTQVFRDKHREAVERAGVAGLIVLWARTVFDLLFTAFAERRSASTPSASKLERTLQRIQLLRSPWQTHNSRSWAIGAILIGVLNITVNASILLYGSYDAERSFPVLLPLGGLAIGLTLICQGAGNLLQAKNGTVALLLRAGSVFLFGPLSLVCSVALVMGLFGLLGTLWRADGVLAVALLLYTVVKLLPSHWQAHIFGEDDAN